jgi:hypothetical protein
MQGCRGTEEVQKKGAGEQVQRCRSAEVQGAGVALGAEQVQWCRGAE